MEILCLPLTILTLLVLRYSVIGKNAKKEVQMSNIFLSYLNIGIHGRKKQDFCVPHTLTVFSSLYKADDFITPVNIV